MLRPSRERSNVLRVAGRELRIVGRSRGAVTGLLVVAAVAWLPPLLLPLRAGALGVASFAELLPLAVAIEGVMLPLVALLFGADMLAGEAEDGSLLGIVTLPLSRTSCFLGKLAGRAAALAAVEAAAFGSAAAVLAGATGAAGLGAYLLVQGSALLMSVACVAIGAALAAGGRGRVHAYGLTLLTWVLLVFLIDAVLLAGIVALAPPAPAQIGAHGHSELSAAMPLPEAPAADAPAEAIIDRAGAWLLALDPVDLFRLGALAADAPAGEPPHRSAAAPPLAAGWLAWLVLPAWIGVRRFRRMPLR